LLNAVMFVIIHYPIWIYRAYTFGDYALSSVSVFLLSILFSWAFIKTKNIFVPIALHMSWNFFTITLWGS